MPVEGTLFSIGLSIAQESDLLLEIRHSDEPSNNLLVPASDASTTAFRCSLCPNETQPFTDFTSTSEKRQHFACEWHKFNATLQHRGYMRLFAEDEFNELHEDDRNAILKEPTVDRDLPIEFLRPEPRKQFTVVSVKNQTRFITYTEIMYPKSVKNNGELGDQALTTLFNIITKPRTWIILLLSSGKFIVGIFDNTSGKCIDHVSLKAYVARAKQGGSQMIRDRQSHKVASSAGSQIRRENERKWLDSIGDALRNYSCKGYLDAASLIFYQCSVYYQSYLFPLISSDKSKLRSIPFTTFKPNIYELERCYRQLATISVVSD